jgi:hypothetical protein
MKTIFNWLVLIACACNAIDDGRHWYKGDTATGYVWFAAIGFSIFIALDCLSSLFKK